jgi:hypothetical protein
MKLLRTIGGAFSVAMIIGLLTAAVPAGAQTLTSLTMERVLTLSSAQSSLTSNLPASVLASIASGTLEIHEQSNYNPQANTLTSTFFLEPAGTTTTPPTNLGTVAGSSVLAIVALTPDKIYVTSSAVQFVGLISQSNTPLFGTASYQGVPATFSFGYTSATPPAIHDVIDTVAGVAVAYTASATGTFVISQPTGPTGPGGGGSGVTVSVNGSTGATISFQTTVNQLTLNASASTSSNAGSLTYAWSIPTGAPSVGISFPGGNTAMAFVQLAGGKQAYTITLTVTDSTGATATSTITIDFI